MSFEEFKKMTYHTRKSIRIPGSNTSIDKVSLIGKKGKFDFAKQDELLRRVYEEENYKDK
jgi:hypothetical protein